MWSFSEPIGTSAKRSTMFMRWRGS
jgi:hypothetical protein